jgi:hypothetical protein
MNQYTGGAIQTIFRAFWHLSRVGAAWLPGIGWPTAQIRARSSKSALISFVRTYSSTADQTDRERCGTASYSEGFPVNESFQRGMTFVGAAAFPQVR